MNNQSIQDYIINQSIINESVQQSAELTIAEAYSTAMQHIRLLLIMSIIWSLSSAILYILYKKDKIELETYCKWQEGFLMGLVIVAFIFIELLIRFF